MPESQTLSYELDCEGFKLVPDRLDEKAGIHPMLHRQLVAPIMTDSAVLAVIVESCDKWPYDKVKSVLMIFKFI